ncbi:MAG TPA: uroporphyrinogen-III synthase [Burkholderiaceae bacterium]|nr:uroporphyrinogen-III synthase [Burkholderiaceae bacterium]HQR70618.1 uroporphyrinogen-III synthase [Burkholderiaceae bacterium]
MKPPVVVTRPAPAGPRLVRRLQLSGRDAVWWPAFTLGPPPDPELAHATLQRLADFDLAIFVSPAAVQAVAELRAAPWPDATAVGAVGAATARAVQLQLGLSAKATVVAPTGDDAGSEAFWEAWSRLRRPVRQVLILRAQHGRDWLGEQFAAAGASVSLLPVYTRADAPLDDVACLRLREWVRDGTPAIAVVSSSEAVDALDRQVAAVPEARGWLRQGVAIATHERVAARLLAAGYTRVELTSADDDLLMARLESMQSL